MSSHVHAPETLDCATCALYRERDELRSQLECVKRDYARSNSETVTAAKVLTKFHEVCGTLGIHVDPNRTYMERVRLQTNYPMRFDEMFFSAVVHRLEELIQASTPTEPKGTWYCCVERGCKGQVLPGTPRCKEHS